MARLEKRNHLTQRRKDAEHLHLKTRKPPTPLSRLFPSLALCVKKAFRAVKSDCRPPPSALRHPSSVLCPLSSDGRRLSDQKLKQLPAAVGLTDYTVVATNTKRYERRLQSDPTEQSQMKAVSQLLNCEM